MVDGTAYEIGLIKEYEIKITGGSARSNVTYNGKTYYGNETLLVKDGESMTVVVANGNNGFGYAMKIFLNGVVVAGGNDWGHAATLTDLHLKVTRQLLTFCMIIRIIHAKSPKNRRST